MASLKVEENRLRRKFRRHGYKLLKGRRWPRPGPYMAFPVVNRPAGVHWGIGGYDLTLADVQRIAARLDDGGRR